MRPGQHNNNKQRGRSRNRGRHSGGGSSNGSGSYSGNPANRVYDSNGPDVKLRGTAQTVAEKYMQLGRDSQASGDTVAAESYFQHSEHYYRLWLANQPAGQPIQFPRRTDEEYEEDQAEGADSDDETSGESVREEGAESGEAAASTVEGDASPGQDQQPPRSGDFRPQRQRDPRDQHRDGGREGARDGGRDGGRERFRQRWPRRNERGFDQARDEQSGQQQPAPELAPAAEQDTGNWEAPSFLTRPVPPQVIGTSDEPAEVAPDVKRPRREPKPRRSREEAVADAPEPTVSDSED